MFDYIKNKYNPTPALFLENDFKEGYIYIPYIKAPYLALPNNNTEFKLLHKRKFWYNIRRSIKLYEAKYGDLHFDILHNGTRLDFYLDEVASLFNKRWASEYTSAEWKTSVGFKLYKNAMIDLASSKESFLAILTDNKGKLLSYGYCLTQKQTVYFYQHTTDINDIYRKYSLGKILIHNLLKYSIECTYKEFDFMTGQTPYKLEWTKDARMIYREIGKINFLNYFKSYIYKVRYFIQFNKYSRSLLKPIMLFLERIYAKFKVSN